MKDDDSRRIKAGDILSLTVGIPGREVRVTVRSKRGRLVVDNDEGSMSLSRALRYFPAEVVEQ